LNGVPADGAAANASGVREAGIDLPVTTPDAFAGATLDAAKLLDIDVDQLARALTLITDRGL
jgi:hypothetical protein